MMNVLVIYEIKGQFGIAVTFIIITVSCAEGIISCEVNQQMFG